METKTYRGGAPKKEEENKRIRRVELRFKEDEYAKLISLKEKTSLHDLASFIRHVCLGKPLPMKPQTSTHEEKLLSLIREMRSDVLRIGVNINQSVKRINTTTDYPDLRLEINIMSGYLNQLDVQLSEVTSLIAVDQCAGNPQKEAAHGNPN